MMHRLKPQIGPGRELGLGWRGAVFPLPLVVHRYASRPHFAALALQCNACPPCHFMCATAAMAWAWPAIYKPCAQIWIASIASSSFGPII